MQVVHQVLVTAGQNQRAVTTVPIVQVLHITGAQAAAVHQERTGHHQLQNHTVVAVTAVHHHAVAVAAAVTEAVAVAAVTEAAAHQWDRVQVEVQEVLPAHHLQEEEDKIPNFLI